MTADSTATRMTRYRWLVCVLLFFATTILYIDRQIVSIVKPVLDEQWHWTNKQFGLVNSFFQGAYAVGLLGFGWFIDRFGVKLGYGVSLACWGVAAASNSLVSGVMGFRFVRLLVGASEAGNFPCAIKAVAQWFPRKERAY